MQRSVDACRRGLLAAMSLLLAAASPAAASMRSTPPGPALAAADEKATPWSGASITGDVDGAAAPPSAQAATPASQARPLPPPAAEPVTATETECETLAAFHLPATTSAAVHETAATDWHRAAALCQAEVQAHPGDPRFLYALGRAQDHLNNSIEALRDFRAAADAGHVDALVELGILYYRGRAVVQSFPTAFVYMEKAANAGSARALGNLAALYGNGQGVPKDELKALDLAEKAIEAGNPNGLELVADAYLFGQGVPKDYPMAAQYLQQGIALGDGWSMKRLASMYEAGYLGAADPAKASDLRRMAQRIDPESQDPTPARLPSLRQTSLPVQPAHRRRYVIYRPYGGTSWDHGQPMVGGIFRAPAAGATCCPPSALICPGALPRC